MNYESSSQQLIIQAIEALSTRPLSGCSTPQLQEMLGCSRDQAFRTAKNLEIAGWAEPASDGRWKLAPRATLLAERFRRDLADTIRTYLGDNGS